MIRGKMWHLCLLIGSLALSSPGVAAPIASSDLILHAQDSFSSGGLPNTYHVDASGAFKGFFYAPFSASDLAVDKSGGVLFGSGNSNLLVRTDTRGGLLDLIPTPSARIDGVGVASNGNLVVANGNLIYQLDSRGGFLGLVFSPVRIGPFGIDASDRVVFLQQLDFFDVVSISFLDLIDRTITSVATTLRSASGIDVTEAGEILVAGSTDFFSSPSSIYRFDGGGNLLGIVIGPDNVRALAIANLPEPTTAVLLGGALVGLAAVRRRS